MNPNYREPKAMAGLYTVRLTVEGMKHAIETALVDHDGTLRASIEAELKSVVEKFDFRGEIQKIAVDALRRVVGNAIQNAVTEAFLNPAVNAELNLIISQHLTSILREYRK